MFHTTSTIVYKYAKSQRKPEIAFPSVKEWNENEDGMIVSGVSDFMNIFEDANLSGSVSVTAYPLPAADNRPVLYDLMVYPTILFDKETTTYELFLRHPSILYMGLCETALVNVALHITLMSINQRLAIPPSVPLKDDATFVLGANLLSGHFYGDSLAKQEHWL
jgi:hypothetical protein